MASNFSKIHEEKSELILIRDPKCLHKVYDFERSIENLKMYYYPKSKVSAKFRHGNLYSRQSFQRSLIKGGRKILVSRIGTRNLWHQKHAHYHLSEETALLHNPRRQFG